MGRRRERGQMGGTGGWGLGRKADEEDKQQQTLRQVVFDRQVETEFADNKMCSRKNGRPRPEH